MSRTYKVNFPVMVDVGIDFMHGGYQFVRDENGNTPDGKKVADYILKYFRKNKVYKDGFEVNCDFGQEYFFLIFENPSCEYIYNFYPGTMATLSDPGDPDDYDIDGPLLEEDDCEFFANEVRTAIKEMPFDIKFQNGKSIKSSVFLTNNIFVNNFKFPTEEQIFDKVSDLQAEEAEKEDAYYRELMGNESVINSILNGKTLTEALMEKADGNDHVNIAKVKRDAIKSLRELVEAYYKVNNLVFGKPMFPIIDKLHGVDCPIKNLASAAYDIKVWAEELENIIKSSEF